jgi:hypothetical protein
VAEIRENLEFIKKKCEIVNEMQDKGGERPYDIMLNWLVGRPDMVSVESFQVKSAGISRTISLELGVATDHFHGRHEGMRMEYELEKSRRGFASRSRERIIQTTRGVLDLSDNSKFMTDPCY